ncbi:MAG: thioredoxin family protein [Cryobacterium sp.]|nr:thioredoxin family protein [Oligoflexia bacterium]
MTSLSKSFLALSLFTASLCSGFGVTNGFADAKINQPAPEFRLTDTEGKTHTLSALKGKTVVLEWLNFECPFVKKHYSSGNMQKLQAEAAKDGVIWLSVVSSAKGKQGFYEPKEMRARKEKEKSNTTAILYDTDGKIGKMYGAKSTPHLFIVDATGNLVYRGAIDDKPSTDAEDIAKSKNYVTAALADLKAKRPVATAETESYGCGVKY